MIPIEPATDNAGEGIRNMKYIVALTIAGSDPSGGAGVQADMKTMSALGVYACSAITSLTVQNTIGVESVYQVEPIAVRKQIESVLDDMCPVAVKIGMLDSAEVVKAVCDALSGRQIDNIILDPVMVSSSGKSLLSAEALSVMRERLLPKCSLVTPNIPEAEILAGMKIVDDDSRVVAAHKILSYGMEAVLIKGGHSESTIKKDLLLQTGKAEKWFSMPEVETKNTHGTGCTLSSAICSYLALGEPLDEAVRKAKEYVYKALVEGANVEIGKGAGPLCHFFDPMVAVKRETNQL